jgi:hypothetical protein
VTTLSRSLFAWMGWLSSFRRIESESARHRPPMLPRRVQRLKDDKLQVRRGNLRPFKLNRIVQHGDP